LVDNEPLRVYHRHRNAFVVDGLPPGGHLHAQRSRVIREGAVVFLCVLVGLGRVRGARGGFPLVRGLRRVALTTQEEV
jgi:hypothetical protein